MDADQDAMPQNMTITVIGDPAAFARAMFDGVDATAVDELVDRMGRHPRLMRRFGDVPIRRASLVLAAIGPETRAAIRRSAAAEGRPRSGRRRASSRARSPDREDPDPPLARCAHCSADFTPARRDTQFCSHACKQAAYRRRHKTPELADIVWRLRLAGEIDGADALLLLIAPPTRVLDRLAAGRRA
jgi:hypothetical protein